MVENAGGFLIASATGAATLAGDASGRGFTMSRRKSESPIRQRQASGAASMPTLVFAAVLVICLVLFAANVMRTTRPEPPPEMPALAPPPIPESTAAKLNPESPEKAKPDANADESPDAREPANPVPGPLVARPLVRPPLPHSPDPAQVMETVASAMLGGEVDAVVAALGAKIMDSPTSAALTTLLGPSGYAVDAENAVSQLGSQPTLQLWAVNLRSRTRPEDRSLVEFVFTRQGAGRWQPTQVILPGSSPQDGSGPHADPSAKACAMTFARSIFTADFAAALACGSRKSLAPEALVGLAVLADEGEFQIREANPLTTTMASKSAAWFLVQIVSRKWQIESRFGLVVQATADGQWQVTAVNLDSMLAVSAIRLGGGDPAFTPLIRSPGEGDALVVYFAGKSTAIDARGQQLLAMVGKFATCDPGLSLRLDGHADAGEKDGVERVISKARAEEVAKTLAAAGIDSGRLMTDGHGASKPRRANFRPDGQEDSAARRLNRRVELRFTKPSSQD